MNDDLDKFIDNFDINLNTLKPVNHVMFIIDISGSMLGNEEFIINSFNRQLDIIKKNREQDTYVSLVFFNNVYNIIFYEQKIEDIKKLSINDIYTCGLTSFYDVFAEMILNLNIDIKELSDKNKNHSALVIVITDGMDNTSENYNYDKVKSIIKELEKNETWTFTFAGVDFAGINEYSGLSDIRNTVNIKPNNINVFDFFDESLDNYYKHRLSGETNIKYYYSSDYTSFKN